MARRILITLLVLLLAAIAVFIAISWRVEIAPIEPPARSSFDTALVSRGATLAAIGNCVACHTAAGGKAYAGGYPMHTPFGTIHGTNITPEPETGIGRWSQAAFARAMREGIDRRGRHLYPAFPYNHYTRVGDEDLNALYAFLMTREPVRAERPRNDLVFPLEIRMLVSGWNLLFLDRQAFRPDPQQSEEWNRGAYLVHGLGHCGACHTPRNALGGEKKHAFLAGGEAEGWHAPALDASSPAPVPWNAQTLYRYLRYGASATHEVAAGPMASVVHNLGAAPEQEVRAIAVYLASAVGAAGAERERRAERAMAHARGDASGGEPQAAAARIARETDAQIGAVVYTSTCAVCHGEAERPPGSPSGQALHLALTTSIALPDPGNLIRIILQGMAPPDGEPGPYMPGFHGALTDEQIAALATYLRTTYTDRPEWQGVAREVRRARQSLAEAHR